MTFTDMHTILEPATAGVAKLDLIEISAMESAFSSVRGGLNYVTPGKYVRLLVNGGVMMSDTRMERLSNSHVVRHAKGDVLISGLGLGMLLVPILAKPEVTSLTVLEKYQDVIDIVLPQLQAKLPPEHMAKLKVVLADVLEFKVKELGGQKFDVVYHDIWPDICTDNLTEVTALKRKFAKSLKPEGWQGAWMEDTLRSRRVKEKKEERRWYR